MRAAAALLSISLLMFGCFPHDAHNRTIAQLIEGGSIAAGIGVEAFVSTGADCDSMGIPGQPVDVNCHNRSSTWGGVGVALMLAGLLGFIATISTAEDDAPEAPRIDIKAKPEPTPVGATGGPAANPTTAPAAHRADHEYRGNRPDRAGRAVGDAVRTAT